MIVFETIKSRRLSETIENYIKDLILNQKLKPDERLPTEKEISRQFGVSPVTVREALRALETFGLIKKKKGKKGGIFVSETRIDVLKAPLYSYMNAKNVNTEHIAQLRMIIEPAIVRAVVSQITENDFRALDRNVKDCEKISTQAKDGLSEHQLKDLKEKTIDFHKLLAEPVKNPVLSLTLDYVLDFLYTFKKDTYALDVEFLTEQVKEHRIILTSIQSGDEGGTERMLVTHLQKAAEYHKKKSMIAPQKQENDG